MPTLTWDDFVIVNHRFNCGTTYVYVLPLSRPDWDAAFTAHRQTCKECAEKARQVDGIRDKVNSFVPMGATNA